MAHTDKTDPYLIRHPVIECECDEYFSGCNCLPQKPYKYTNAECLVAGPKGIRAYKRMTHKADRRSEFPRTSFRGYGWGVSNYRYSLSD